MIVLANATIAHSAGRGNEGSLERCQKLAHSRMRSAVGAWIDGACCNTCDHVDRKGLSVVIQPTG
jgi:hypothetical protein